MGFAKVFWKLGMCGSGAFWESLSVIRLWRMVRCSGNIFVVWFFAYVVGLVYVFVRLSCCDLSVLSWVSVHFSFLLVFLFCAMSLPVGW